MELKQDTLYIFTDGSCYPNPGPGGYAAILIFNGHVKFVYGGSENETNNSMELRAINEALKARTDHVVPTVLYTDSQYCVNALTKWWKGWQSKGWVTGAGNPVKNKALIQDIIPRTKNVVFKWLKGHSGHHFNEAADQLARKGRACVEEHPTEDPEIGDIQALMMPFVPDRTEGLLPVPFDDPDEIVEMKPTEFNAPTPAPTRAPAGELRDILAGMFFMDNLGKANEIDLARRGYEAADKFIAATEKARKIDKT